MSKADSAQVSEVLNFLVQVSKEVGVGHLTRSAAVVRELIKSGLNVQLTLISDDYGREVAGTLGVCFSEILPASTSVVVVDAIEIKDSEADWVLSHHHRLIISPVFNRFDLATHVIVRNLPESMKGAIPKDVKLVEDEGYAFVTSQEVVPVSRSYSELCIGVCLTGGGDLISLKPLLDELVTINRLKELRLISNTRPSLSDNDAISFAWSGFVENPWDFLQSINIFVGGEGVMLSESVARGIPAISLKLKSKANKNKSLVDSGAVKVIDRDPLDITTLLSLLSDVSVLEEMHQQAMKAATERQQNNLPNKILEIFTFLKSDQHVDSRSYC